MRASATSDALPGSSVHSPAEVEAVIPASPQQCPICHAPLSAEGLYCPRCTQLDVIERTHAILFDALSTFQEIEITVRPLRTFLGELGTWLSLPHQVAAKDIPSFVMEARTHWVRWATLWREYVQQAQNMDPWVECSAIYALVRKNYLYGLQLLHIPHPNVERYDASLLALMHILHYGIMEQWWKLRDIPRQYAAQPEILAAQAVIRRALYSSPIFLVGASSGIGEEVFREVATL